VNYPALTDGALGLRDEVRHNGGAEWSRLAFINIPKPRLLRRGSQKNKYGCGGRFGVRVRAYRFRAYSSKTTAGVLKTQLEASCKLYNTLLHAEQEEYEKNKRTMSRNELRQLALDLRKQNPEFQVLHSQVAQQVAERFYQARERFLDGLANKPKKKKPYRYLSLVYPQSGWRLSNTRDAGQGKNKKRKLGFALVKSASLL